MSTLTIFLENSLISRLRQVEILALITKLKYALLEAFH